jgi:hypothetical protein
VTIPLWELVAGALLVLVALYLRGLAGRLDRLHLRVEAARETLDAQLLRRAGAVLDLATNGGLDMASAFLLAEAATAARDAPAGEREVAESALSEDVRAVLDAPGTLDLLWADPVGRELLEPVALASERVGLARRFHNDAVRSVRALRRKGVVRVLHLAGRAALPESFEMDDAPPASLSRMRAGPT